MTRRRTAVVAAGLTVLAEALALKRLGYGLAGDVVVRCRQGHRFTTLWVPGVSVKSVRLGWWRVQRCPAGPHWSIVTPVDPAQLTQEERRSADALHDLRVP